MFQIEDVFDSPAVMLVPNLGLLPSDRRLWHQEIVSVRMEEEVRAFRWRQLQLPETHVGKKKM